VKKVLIIDTGGTISQKPDSSGILKPSVTEYIDQVPNIEKLADLSFCNMERIDSTNMTTEYRGAIAGEIYKRHHEFDGFVILHGTDTMADTACALTYMIQNLGKPIVITGAQLPIFSPGPDGINNLYYSVEAATRDLGETVICFGDRIMRGSRAVKENTHGFNAFSSPRLTPIGELGVTLRLLDHRIKRFKGNPVLFTDFDTDIIALRQTSGSTANVLEHLLEANLSGLVIGGFGTGNIQSRLIDSMKKFSKKGIPMVIATVCHKGSTMLRQYSVGQAAAEAGAIEAKDLTHQAAVQKLMYACGKVKKDFSLLSLKDKKELIYSIFNTPIARDMAEIDE
jgi:L-asparaginase